jgi:hypothetical protein
MKTLSKFFIIVTISILITDCSKHDNSSSTEITSPASHYSRIEPGKIAVTFVDSINQSEAVLILDSLNLRTYILFGFDTNVRHTAVIDVPIDEEQKWIDILTKHPAIKSVSPLVVIEET